MLSRRRGTRIYEETSRMKQLIRRLWTNESGQDMVMQAVSMAMLPPRSRGQQAIGTSHRHFSNNVLNNLNTV